MQISKDKSSDVFSLDLHKKQLVLAIDLASNRNSLILFFFFFLLFEMDTFHTVQVAATLGDHMKLGLVGKHKSPARFKYLSHTQTVTFSRPFSKQTF